VVQEAYPRKHPKRRLDINAECPLYKIHVYRARISSRTSMLSTCQVRECAPPQEEAAAARSEPSRGLEKIGRRQRDQNLADSQCLSTSS
jgi:hypothetical protein